ncbi:MAG: ABC transporter permease [Mesorhizobium sp.]|nr:MAG: ABC transporter permease [Mesorhizobium sp.]
MASTSIRQGKKVRDGRPPRQKWGAVVLIAPLALFLLFVYAVPLYEILARGVVDNELSTTWPRVSAALHGWNAQVPGEDVFAALAEDMKASQKLRITAIAARRLNYAQPGGRTLVMSTARQIAGMEAPPATGWKAAFVQINPLWNDREIWQDLYQASGPVSGFFLLAAFDRRLNADGGISLVPSDNRIYVDILLRTFAIALSVTLVCLVMAFPLAYLMANGPPKLARLAFLLVLLPLWTSVLVRTAAWFVLLQDEGLINQGLRYLGITSDPVPLIFNRFGLIVAMVHVSLPYMVLPIYASMKAIKPDYLRAALSLGAKPLYAFIRVYMPLAIPGLAAGSILVFIMALGYYITPALIGGASDQMISYFIAYYTTDSVNWGFAGALSIVLLVATSVLYVLYSKLSSGKGAAVA